MKFLNKILFLVFVSAPLHAFGVHGVISERIAHDIGAVNVSSSDAVEGTLELSRISFAVGRLSGEDGSVLRSIRSVEEGFEFTLSDGVICRVQSSDLRAGVWRPVPTNVRDVPRPVSRGENQRPLMLRPCASL